MQDNTEISMLLGEVREGNSAALDRLLPIVYDELRRLAGSYMEWERNSHTLQTTALIHEAYLRLAVRKEKKWLNRSHFFANAAEAMRSILVDHARKRMAAKRGAGAPKIDLDQSNAATAGDPEELLALDNALARLAATDPRQAKIVELRYFTGLTVPEVAAVLEISERTVTRDWCLAKAWLHGEIRKRRDSGP